MAYLLLFIIFALIAVILLTPISILLSFDGVFKANISLPFIDFIISSSPERKSRPRKKRKRSSLRRVTRTLKASRRALDMLLRHSSLTVFLSKDDVSRYEFVSSFGKRILFSVFISYLASKSGILITSEGSSTKDKHNSGVSAQIETRVFYLTLALISFAVIKFLTKKEYGIVR